MEKEQLKNIIEAILMVAEEPMTLSDLLKFFDAELVVPERADIREALNTLQADYEQRGMELVEVASGFRIQAQEKYAGWVNRLFDEKPARYSRALLETLAIIAYKQPITRSEIEEIRGVSVSSNIIKTLQERVWIRIVGHRDVPGKPALIATTKEFLDYFNLKKLSELPSLAEIKDFDQMNPDLFEGMDINPADLIDKNEEETEQNTEAVDEATSALELVESTEVDELDNSSDENEEETEQNIEAVDEATSDPEFEESTTEVDELDSSSDEGHEDEDENTEDESDAKEIVMESDEGKEGLAAAEDDNVIPFTA